MASAGNCIECGVALHDGATSNRCTLCGVADDLLSGPHPSAAAHPPAARPTDAGRILRTGALPHAPTMPVATMPRLMTADVEAAAAAARFATPDEDDFTLSDDGPTGATREAWSIGENGPREEVEATPRPSARTALPRALVVTAGLVALVAVAALVTVTAKPTGGDASGSGAGSDVREADRIALGSGAIEPTKPAPEERPSEQPKAPAGRSPAPADDATPTAPAPAQDAKPAAPASAEDATPAVTQPPVVTPPPDFAANMRAGRSALDKGNLSAALTAFKAAAALRPKSAEAITGIARAQAGGDQNAEAIKSFETAVVLNPDYTPAWSGLAHLRETSGNRDGAIDAYRRVVSISPDSRDAKIAREALSDLGVTAP